MHGPHDTRLETIERQYGRRPRIPAAHGEPLKDQHWRGETQDGKLFVYCPRGFIVSWHPEDFKHNWCAWCKIHFGGPGTPKPNKE